MTQDRNAIIKALKPYFEVSELVCPHTFSKYNERSWQFLDTNALYGLLIMRESIFGVPMYVNNYKNGKTQRGLRCNKCDLVKGKATLYLSQHIFGKAWDFTVQGYTAEQARRKIIENAHLFPFNFRLESDVNWVHWDCLDMYNNTAKVYIFKG